MRARQPSPDCLGFIAPALPKPTESPAEDDGWLHEIKHDGYRTVLVVDRGQVRAFTRAGHDCKRSDHHCRRCVKSVPTGCGRS
jgi:ATP-dependent DNA ligase